MPDQATVTAKAGAAITVTAGVYYEVSSFSVDTEENVLRIVARTGISYFALTGNNTFTLTASDGSYTLTVA